MLNFQGKQQSQSLKKGAALGNSWQHYGTFQSSYIHDMSERINSDMVIFKIYSTLKCELSRSKLNVHKTFIKRAGLSYICLL